MGTILILAAVGKSVAGKVQGMGVQKEKLFVIIDEEVKKLGFFVVNINWRFLFDRRDHLLDIIKLRKITANLIIIGFIRMIAFTRIRRGSGLLFYWLDQSKFADLIREHIIDRFTNGNLALFRSLDKTFINRQQ